jgi:hypothetical protein
MDCGGNCPPDAAMGKSQEMHDRKGQDDLMSVMIERLKKILDSLN